MDHFTTFMNKWCNALATSPPTLCHYTSREAAKSILSSGQLRFTNLWDMADQHEIVYGRELIRDSIIASPMDNEFMRKWVRPLLEEPTWQRFTSGQNAYIACFCKSPHDPYMWEKFGRNGAGWVLRFNINPDSCQTLVPTFTPTQAPSGIVLRKVIYSREQQIRWIGSLIDAVCKDYVVANPNEERLLAYYFRQGLTEAMVAFKRPDYAGESETRLLFWNPRNEVVVDSTRRYVPVSFRDDAGKWKEPFIGKKLPVIDSDLANLSWEEREFLRQHSDDGSRIFEPLNSHSYEVKDHVKSRPL